MAFVWLIAIVVLVSVGLVLLGLALCLWCRQKEMKQKKNNMDISPKLKNQIKVVLPLPPPGSGDGGASMDPTQISAMETTTTKRTSTEMASEKSLRKEPEIAVVSSKEQAAESFPSQMEEAKSTRVGQDPTDVKQQPTETESAIKTFTPPAGSTTTTTGPVSAGVTPRRKIPAKPLPPPVLPVPLPPPPPPVPPPALPQPKSPPDAPTEGVHTANEISDPANRSEGPGHICDEDAGCTPLGTPETSTTATSRLGTGVPAPSTAGSSRLTTFTPSQSTSETTGGRPI